MNRMLRWVCVLSFAALFPANAADNDHWDDQFGGPGTESEVLTGGSGYAGEVAELPKAAHPKGPSSTL